MLKGETNRDQGRLLIGLRSACIPYLLQLAQMGVASGIHYVGYKL